MSSKCKALCYLLSERQWNFYALLRGGEIRVLSEDPWLAQINEFTTIADHKKMRDQAWLIIKPVVTDQPAIFESKKRGTMVQRLVTEQGITKQTIYRMLRRYWQRGMLPNALLPDYANCGAAGKVRVFSAEHRRPSLSGDNPSPVIDADIRSKIKAIFTSHLGKTNISVLVRSTMNLLQGTSRIP